MKKTVIIILILSLVMACVFPAVVYADSGGAGTANKLKGAARILKNIAIAMALVALAVTGVQILIGGSQEAIKLWPRILTIIVAVIVLLVLPWAISVGRNLAGGGWSPDNISSYNSSPIFEDVQIQSNVESDG